MNTEFASWVPNVSGGVVVSNWETKADWNYEYDLSSPAPRRRSAPDGPTPLRISS